MLALALVAALQSDVDRWIADLGADDVETRDAAEKKLIERRARDAVAKATASDDAEVRTRAERIIRRFEDDEEAEAFLAVPKVSAAYDKKPLAVVLKDWSKASGVKLVCDALPETPVTLAFEDVPLPEALDRLCASLKRVTWDAADPAHIRVWSAEALYKPVAYVSSFRILLQITDGKPLLWPHNYKSANLKIKQTFTDTRTIGGAPEPIDVEGSLEVDLPVGTADVALRKDMLGRPFDVGEVTIQLKEWTDDFASFTMTGTENRDESVRVVGGAVEVVERGGKTTRATLGYDLTPMEVLGREPRCFVTFPNGGTVDEVKFKLKPRTKRLQLPFKIDRIEFGK